MNVIRTGLILFDFFDIIEGPRLKRDFLLVDEIIVDDKQLELSRNYAELQCKLHDKDPARFLNEFDQSFDFLVDQGLVSEINLQDAILPDSILPKVDFLETEAKKQLEKKNPYPMKIQDGSTVYVDPLGAYVINKAKADLFRARCLATELSNSSVFITPFTSGITKQIFDQANESESRVLSVVISNLPVPTADTPWEKIIEFKKDPVSKAKLAQLRGWMVDMSTTTLSEKQIQDKLETALSDYQQHMKIHSLKCNAGAMEVLLVATAEVIENAMRFKFSKALKVLFDFKKADLSLLEAELKSPGREVAFIDSARSLGEA